MTSVNEVNTYEGTGARALIGSSPRLTVACFRARGAAALADKPNMRKMTASKLSLYIFFAEVGGNVK